MPFHPYTTAQVREARLRNKNTLLKNEEAQEDEEAYERTAVDALASVLNSPSA